MKTKIILFLAILLSINFVFAEYDWSTYGNFPYSWNKQYPDILGKFDVGIYNLSMNNGFKFGNGSLGYNNSYQPIISNFGRNGTSMYFFIVNDNNLQVYDQYLNLIQEIETGLGKTQIDSMDFFQDGNGDDILGIFGINQTLMSFRIYSYNHTSLTFNKSFEQNFTVGFGHYVSGIKHFREKAYFVFANEKIGSNFINYFVSINRTSNSIVSLPHDTYPYIEPVMIQDIDGDGNIEFTTFSRNKVISFDESGTIETSLSATGAGDGPQVIRP